MTQIPVRDGNEDPEPQAPAPDDATALSAAADVRPTTDDAVTTNESATAQGEADVQAPEASPEVKAAEQAPDSAEKTNPVGEATQIESKDPYSEGKHIANPEPNNGTGVLSNDDDRQVPGTVSTPVQPDEGQDPEPETPTEPEQPESDTPALDAALGGGDSQQSTDA